MGRSHAEKAIDTSSARGTSASFGPFRLFAAERKVEKDGSPLPLSNRALDLLIVLVEHAGELVSHEELTARVWRGLVVDSGSLRMHITSLRKALGDGGGARYIETVRGRGYRFVAPVDRQDDTRTAEPAGLSSKSALQTHALPPAAARMVGRDEAVREIASDLMAHRFLTIVGPGGIGKTTVVVTVAHAMLQEFRGAVCFVNLGALSDPAHVASTVASTLGITIQAEDALPGLRQSLRSARMLLVLDNCEHVIAAAAALAEQIFREAPHVHILATSREALRVDGEFTYLLLPLECPPPAPDLNAREAQTFPAIELFLACAAASGSDFELSDENAALVAGVCSRLDGIPLAIEFAAGRVGAYGIEGIDSLLGDRFGLDWRGRRTASPRQQTLHATLDWSHQLLSESEQIVLRRLAVFVGSFTLAAARAVVCDRELDDDQAAIDVGDLVAKSLVSAVATEEAMRYRLLETTRSYAFGKLEASGELDATAGRHASFFSRLLLIDSAARGDIDRQPDSAPAFGEHLGNVRAALDWCFRACESDPRRAALGIDLAAAAAPVLLQLRLLTECHKWSARALSLLDVADRGSRKEMVLQETLATAAMWTGGAAGDVRAAIARALEIAHKLGETSHGLRLMAGMHIFLVRAGAFRASLAVAEELGSAVMGSADVSYIVLAHWMRGGSQHFLGDQRAAEQDFEKGFALGGPRNLQLFGLDYRIRALVSYARVLWLAGRSNRAMEVAREAIGEAAACGTSVDVCFSLLYATPVFVWCGEWSTAQRTLGELTQHTNWGALLSFHATELALRGELLVYLGEIDRGTAILRNALKAMKAERQGILAKRAACALADGLIRLGQLDEALAVVVDAIAETHDGEEALEMAELLRLQAAVLLFMPGQGELQAEDCLMRSLECARRQHAPAWELRTATSLARLRVGQGRHEEAHEVLVGVYRSFTEGLETPDLKAAEQLLTEVNRLMDSAA